MAPLPELASVMRKRLTALAAWAWVILGLALYLWQFKDIAGTLITRWLA